MAAVVDASALLVALLGRSTDAVFLRERLLTETCHAPYLIDAEVGNVLRRKVLRAELKPSDAEVLLHSGAPLIDYRYEMTGELAAAAWRLRENFTFYDGLYVALATALGSPLLTADDRMAHAPGLTCAIERVG